MPEAEKIKKILLPMPEAGKVIIIMDWLSIMRFVIMMERLFGISIMMGITMESLTGLKLQTLQRI